MKWPRSETELLGVFNPKKFQTFVKQRKISQQAEYLSLLAWKVFTWKAERAFSRN